MKVTAKITGAFRFLWYKIVRGMSRLDAWQRKPPAIPALSTGPAVCMNCGQSFCGNFCPRCGQSASERKFTFKNTIQKSLEVWGLGNRSLPRTLWHLIYRPGYMIGDYLSGRRMPFFPPVKMLFLITTAHVVISHFFAVHVEAPYDEVGNVHISKEELLGITDTGSHQNGEIVLDGLNYFFDCFYSVANFFDENSAFEFIFVHSIFALVTVFVFRRSSVLPRFTLSESFFSQIFIACQLLLLSMFCVIVTGIDDYGDSMYSMPLPLLFVILCYDYKQLFGFSILSTVLKTAVVFLAWFVSFVLIIAVSMILIILFRFLF